jgi:hydrogenase maturation factor
VAAINAEVGIRGKYHGIGKCFGHTHEAGIGETHVHIGVTLQQFQHGFHIIVKGEIHEHGTALKQSAERRSPTPIEKVESFG